MVTDEAVAVCANLDDDMERTRPKYSSPSMYFENAFWRFLLDTQKGGQHTAPEPRFKQFSENLRNYVVSGALLKVGTGMHHTAKTPSEVLPSLIVMGLGGLGVFMSECQLFGLLILAFHAFVGFTPDDYRAKSVGDNVRKVIKAIVILVLPLMMLWAMWSFASSYVI